MLLLTPIAQNQLRKIFLYFSFKIKQIHCHKRNNKKQFLNSFSGASIMYVCLSKTFLISIPFVLFSLNARTMRKFAAILKK